MVPQRKKPLRQAAKDNFIVNTKDACHGCPEDGLSMNVARNMPNVWGALQVEFRQLAKNQFSISGERLSNSGIWESFRD
jgi:hypothetical protein